MPNSFFQFKQFTVQQANATLKVSTDSCLFGAWVGKELQNYNYDIQNLLDIGTGTGLLMFMLAQQCNAAIDGIEIDNSSFLQAKENLESSPWKSRLNLFNGDVKEFSFTKKYDVIISNPPFYEGDLRSENMNRNLAMHDAGLKLNELLKVVNQNLNKDGFFAVLLPYPRSEKFIKEAEDFQIHVIKRTDVKQSVNHKPFRTMILFGRIASKTTSDMITIKTSNNLYSDEFVELLKEYYLYL